MYFLSENFYFNNISSKSMGIELVSFDNNTFNQIGMTYQESIDKQDSPSSTPFYINSDNKDTEEIVLNLILVNNNDEAQVWDEMKIEEVYDWLVTEDFAQFISEDNLDKIYYFKVSKIVKQFTHGETGYLEVTFKPYSNYSYIKSTLEGNNTIIVNNLSNVDNNYKPVIELTGTGEVSIVNTTVGSEPFTITGLEGKVIVDNLFRTVQSEDGKNLLPKCNRKWIQLTKGKNVLTVTGGTAKVICEFPMIG